ncbi:transcriptional regulator NrdR [Ligilactobacillus pabuli]|nr:transcriptional regulator NrdR [Ligilactobacillus pabuli]HIW88450.1 transcriptional regulator NrdR [Candidatus Ligilactobacillus excrementipullorum]
MMCPQCHHNSSRVVDSRPADNGHAIRRRRECENCGYRFTTFERVEATPLLVIKKNGTREEFDREKILRGIMRSAEKRPVGMDKITSIVDNIESKVRALGGTEVSTQLIGKYVMDELVNVDDVAYIRFASVYREFKDMGSFVNELNELMGRSKDEEDSGSQTTKTKK